MDRLPYRTPPRWWPPRLSRFWLPLLRPIRFARQRGEWVTQVEIRGLENLREAVAQGQGVLIASNHATHADPFVFLHVGDRLGRPLQYVAAWQSFQILRPIGRWVLQRHGCFSVDREGNDLRAFRQSVAILREAQHPLVLFAEGEVYHHYQRIAPFRTGAAAIALAAARRSAHPIVCLPAAITYRYLQDPTPRLLPLMATLERKLLARPRPDLPLADRLSRFANSLLTLRELAYLGRVQTGPFAVRVSQLIELILGGLEKRHGIVSSGEDVPGRVTLLRRQAIKQRESGPASDPRSREAERDLEDLYLVTQLYSYADDYNDEQPSLEHLAEIIDKFEEDVLGAPTAKARAARRGIVTLGQPVEVHAFQRDREGARTLTKVLEQKVQGMLDEVCLYSNRSASMGSSRAAFQAG